MKTHRITSPDDPLLTPFWDIYTHSFPDVELRIFADHQAALQEPDFHCRVLLEDGAVRGLLCFWDIVGLRYIEHFALAPEARNGGTGSRILCELAAETPDDLLLMLEIDPLVDEISRRRLGFYQRLGYEWNDPVYMHPPISRSTSTFR